MNVEPNPDNNYIHDNALTENGGNVSKRIKSIGAPGGDLFWSGKGVGNGWSETTDKTLPGQAARLERHPRRRRRRTVSGRAGRGELDASCFRTARLPVIAQPCCAVFCQQRSTICADTPW